jgi:protein-S-isoprenylcysteine O-methyltransferase Ste14
MPGETNDTKLYDLLIVSPVIAFYGFAAVGIVILNEPRAVQLATHFRWADAFDLAAKLMALVFIGLQIALFILRRPPRAKLPGLLPRLAGILGANVAVAFYLVPQVHNPTSVSMISAGLITVGTLGAIATMAWLNRAFAILPQARVLVTSGPYRYVRHPLYLCEMIATVGVALQFAQPGGMAVLLVVVAAQFPRMHFEEKILGEAFPAYAAYEARTARLVPGLY